MHSLTARSALFVWADLMDAFDADGDNTISLEEFLQCAYQVLGQIVREKAIMTFMDEQSGE